eukprot:6420142-Pyramimonas_sp.AAC.1
MAMTVGTLTVRITIDSRGPRGHSTRQGRSQSGQAGSKRDRNNVQAKAAPRQRGRYSAAAW